MSKNRVHSSYGCKADPSGCKGFENILDSGVHENLKNAMLIGGRSVKRAAAKKLQKLEKTRLINDRYKVTELTDDDNALIDIEIAAIRAETEAV